LRVEGSNRVSKPFSVSIDGANLVQGLVLRVEGLSRISGIGFRFRV